MAGRMPDYNLCIKGEEFAPGKFNWMKIGVAWNEDNGVSITLDTSVPIIVPPGTRMRLFENDKERNRGTDKDF